MDDKILTKIQYLCRAISRVEWSGILLYTIKGSIKKPKNMKLILKDIIPMNKGSQAYTEYQFNEPARDSTGFDDRMIDYFIENPHALEEDWKIGMIHSHNTMEVFFSGTDIEELEDNAPSHNFYLSLIVNNFMDFKAKVATMGYVEENLETNFKSLDENGESYKMDEVTLKVKKSRLFIYDCEIQSPIVETLKVDKLFYDSVESIIEKELKKKIVPQTFTGAKVMSNPSFIQKSFSHPLDSSKKIPQKGFSPMEKIAGKVKTSAVDYSKNLVKDPRFIQDATSYDLHNENVLEFTAALLQGELNAMTLNVSIEVALETVALFTTHEEGRGLVGDIIMKYPTMFEQHFKDESSDDDFFVETTEEIIDILEEFEMEYEFLTEVIMALKQLLHKFEDYATV